LVTMDYHELAKQAKDIAAFSVMLVSIFALITGLIIYYISLFAFIINYFRLYLSIECYRMVIYIISHSF
ncbi:hypothetical protein EDM41_15035, partial [Staphylococcus aureus]